MVCISHRNRLRAILHNTTLAALCVFLFTAALAQEGPAPQPVHSNEVLRGHFVRLRELQGISKPLKSEGEFTLAPLSGLIWNTTKPLASATIFTSTSLVQTSRTNTTQNSSAIVKPISPPNSETPPGQAGSADISPASAAQKLPTLSAFYTMLSGLLASDIPGLGKNSKLSRLATRRVGASHLSPDAGATR